MGAQQELELNRARTALVVIDLQKGIVSRKTMPYDPQLVVENAAKLTDAFRKNSIHVILVRVVATSEDRLNPISDEKWVAPTEMPSDWAEFPEALKAEEADLIITKKQWGAFYGTELDLQLRRRNIDTIVLCGIATNYGVESTARFAYEYGYQQIFAEDAMSAMSEDAHKASVDFVFKRIGRVRETDEIVRTLG